MPKCTVPYVCQNNQMLMDLVMYVTREGPPLPNDRGFGAYGGVAVPYGDSFVYVGGSTIDANSADLYRCDKLLPSRFPESSLALLKIPNFVYHLENVNLLLQV